MNKFLVAPLFFLLVAITTQASGQSLMERLKRKAENMGEKIMYETVEDLLNGKKTTSTSSNGAPVKADPTSTFPKSNMIQTDTIFNGVDTIYHFNTGALNPKDFVSYALTLKGVPYSYGSIDPQYGLDCSGLITHVFNHFNIAVPRRAFDFKNAERKARAKEAKPGDLILFGGSDNLNKLPGHMGIITSVTPKDIEFIHAASGKTNTVITSLLSNSYFQSRFLEVVKVF